MFSIEMLSFGVVLGAERFHTFGPVTMDFKELYTSLNNEVHKHTQSD